MILNPYTPGAGVPPKYLAGREEIIKSAEEALTYITNGYFCQIHSLLWVKRCWKNCFKLY